MIQTPLDKLLAPQSVAVVGASAKPGSLGHDTIEMMLRGGFRGEILPINPRYQEVLGLRCHPDLASVGKTIDLAVLCVAARRLETQIEAAIEAKSGALVITANAILADEPEPLLAARIATRCEAAGIPVCGHNAMGFYNNDVALRVCGFSAPDEGARGGIAFISQSGSVFSTLAHNDPQLRFNLAITTGCETVTALADYVDYALDQDSTKVIALYLETVRKPDRFVAALDKAARANVPVVAMKVGRSRLGAKFALSHSGGMAGDDDALQAVFDRYGVVRTKSLDELANTLLLLDRYPSIPQGGLVAIADSGGERNLLADEAEHVGIDFAALSKQTLTELAAVQEYGQEATNPLDPWGTGLEFERIFGESMAIMMADENAAVGVMSQDLRDGYFLTEGCLQAIDIARERTDKPLAFMTNFSGTRRERTTKALDGRCVPVMSGTRDALHAVNNALRRRDYRYLPKRRIAKLPMGVEAALVPGQVLQEYEALQTLSSAGIPVVPSFRIDSVDDLDALHDRLSFPAVLKTAAPGVLHKTDAGGVVLGVSGMPAMRSAYTEMTARLGPEAIVQPMIERDRELILGLKTDETFGPLIVVGAGGVLAETLRDRTTFLPGAGESEIVGKLEKLRVYPVLEGVRVKQAVDMETLIRTIVGFSDLCLDLDGRAREIDINPLHVSPEGVVALDALIVVAEQ